jgi:hypothetical protein
MRKGTCTIYFYCRHGIGDRNSFIAVVGGLLAQIVKTNPNFANFMYEKLAVRTVKNQTLDELKELLEVGLRSLSNVFVVIDGLDECKNKEHKNLLTWLRNLLEKLPNEFIGSLRYLLLSQEDSITSKCLKDVPRIQLRSEGHENDISLYIDDLGGKIKKRFRLIDDDCVEFIRTVKKNTDGMFTSRIGLLHSILQNRHVLVRKTGTQECYGATKQRKSEGADECRTSTTWPLRSVRMRLVNISYQI